MTTTVLTLLFSLGLLAGHAPAREIGVGQHLQAPPPSQQESSVGTVDAIAGSYRFSGGTSEREALRAAIEETVEPLGPIARKIARDRITKGNQIPENLEIQRQGAMVIVGLDGRRYRAPIDGSPVHTHGLNGDPVTYRVTVRNERLRQTFTHEEGKRADTISVRSDDRLVVRVIVSADKLPRSLKYRLTYARQ